MSRRVASKWLRVPRELLYTDQDPHASERRALVERYPGAARIEAEPIEAIRASIEMGPSAGGAWLYEKPLTSRYAEIFEAPPPEDTPPELSAEAREALERAELACAPGLAWDARGAILDPKLTSLELAKFMAAHAAQKVK